MDTTQVDLVSHAIFFLEVDVTITISVKDDLYHDQFLIDMFILVIKVFDNLHQQANGFFHQNMVKGVKGYHNPNLGLATKTRACKGAGQK
jgi:hypothetical protein